MSRSVWRHGRILSLTGFITESVPKHKWTQNSVDGLKKDLNQIKKSDRFSGND